MNKLRECFSNDKDYYWYVVRALYLFEDSLLTLDDINNMTLSELIKLVDAREEHIRKILETRNKSEKEKHKEEVRNYKLLEKEKTIKKEVNSMVDGFKHILPVEDIKRSLYKELLPEKVEINNNGEQLVKDYLKSDPAKCGLILGTLEDFKGLLTYTEIMNMSCVEINNLKDIRHKQMGWVNTPKYFE